LKPLPDLQRLPPDAQSLDAIIDALESRGWGVFSNILPLDLATALAQRARSLGSYEQARVGRRRNRQVNTFVRRDSIAWIKGEHPLDQAWLTWADSLRLHINRSLMLGLVGFESHYAYYRPGTFYRRHVDAFRGDSNRVVSLVCYLNPSWQAADAGELVLYDPDADGRELGRFPPTLGTLAVYLSEVFPHEVLPTTADRFSLTGWFRSRSVLPVRNF
jgi:SM-20-related protein